MKSKKWILIKAVQFIIVASVLCLTITSCGAGNKGKNSDTSSVNQNTQAASTGLPSGELIYWSQEYCQRNLQTCLDMFNKVYPDISFTTETIPNNELLNKLLLAFSSGTGMPDICTFSTWYMPMLISTGQLLDITDRIKPYINDINKTSLAQVKSGDKYYAVPLDASPVGIIYNVKLFEQAGLDTDPEKVSEMLSTWDKYIEVGKIIRQKTGAGMMTFSGETPSADFINTLVLQQGAWYIDAAGNFKFDIPAMRNAVSLILKMKEAGILEDVTAWTQPWYDLFANRKVAAYLGEVWMGGFLAGWICPDTSGEWRVVPMPMWEAGGLRSSDSCGSSWFITKNTKNPEASWAAAEFYALNEEAVLKQYEATDQFPTYEKTYSDSFFFEPVEFFGNQPVRSVFASLVKSIPDQSNFSKNFELYRTNITVMMQKVLLNNMSIDQAVKQTEADILTQM